MDLRSRVIDHIKLGNSQKATSKLFQVSTSAISRWWIRYQAEGIINPKPRLGSKGRVNSESLQAFVEANSDKTLLEIGSYLGVSACSIYRRLKTLGFSYKKKPSPMWKRIKKSGSDT
jgi:transposase